jgi:hypothetical protein
MAEITEFNIGQGETFRILTTITDNSSSATFDITNYDFAGQVRENYSTDEVAANFTITKLPPYVSGSLFIELTPTDTSNLTQRKYVYDVKMTSGSITPISRRILEGYLIVRPSATR